LPRTRRGRGAPAFKLTSSVVDTGVYALTRNPMSFGFYAGCLGGALLTGSSYLLLYTVLGVIPAHLFNLKFLEELELRLRYGQSYERYRASMPFLLPRFRPRATH
jgi:protein-S-isoprenylcysteine O-methyltransferase Ste14